LQFKKYTNIIMSDNLKAGIKKDHTVCFIGFYHSNAFLVALYKTTKTEN